MIHLHNGISCSRKEEGAPTPHDSMDGTGEQYAKKIYSFNSELIFMIWDIVKQCIFYKTLFLKIKMENQIKVITRKSKMPKWSFS